jgi:hypothetical protein
MTGQINKHKQRKGVGAYGIKKTEHKTSEDRQIKVKTRQKRRK